MNVEEIKQKSNTKNNMKKIIQQFRSKLGLLLCLVAFLLCAQGAVADNAGSNWFDLTFSGASTEKFEGYNNGSTAVKDLGTLDPSKLPLKINEWHCWWWKNKSGNICGSGKLYYKVDDASGFTSMDQGGWSWDVTSTDCKYENISQCNCSYKTSASTNIATSSTTVGEHTMTFYFYASGNPNGSSNCGDLYNSNSSKNYQVKFTIPGYSTTSGLKAIGDVNVGDNSEVTINTTHYGSNTTAKATITGTNADQFSTSSVTATSFKVKFSPTSAGEKSATVTITDAYSKTYTLTVTGTGVQACTPPTAVSISGTAAIDLDTPSTEVTLTASATGTGPYVYNWTITQNPGTGASLSSTSAQAPKATFSKTGTYKFKVGAKCSDAAEYVESSEYTVTVSAPTYKYWIKHPWGGGGDESWKWKELEFVNTGECAWVYTGSYGGTGCNIGYTGTTSEPESSEWYGSPAVVGSPATGDMCDFKFVPSTKQSAASGSVTITKQACSKPSISSQPAFATYCQGATATALSVTATGTATLTYQWQKSTDGGSNYSNISGAESSTYTPSTTSAGTTLYKCVVTNSCGNATSNAATIKVDATPVAGNITGAGAICIDNDSRTLTLNGSSGTREWQFSNSEGGPYDKADGDATGTTYVVNSGHGGWYKVKVTNGVCTEVYATAVEVTEDAKSAPGNLSPGTAGTTICVGSSKILKTTGSVGSLQWKQSTSATGTYTNVTSGTGATTASYNTGVVASAGNTYYKVEAKNGVCPVVLSDYTFVSALTVPTASDFTMTNNEQSCGSVVAPTITKTSGIGNMTVYYSNATYSKSTTLPTAVGTYKVTVDVAKGGSYCATSGIELTNSFIINKANQAALTISTSAAKHICTQTNGAATQKQLEVSGGTISGVVTYAITGGSAQAYASVGANTGILTCSEAGTVEVTATMAGNDCYNDVVSTPKTFTFDKMTQAATITGAGEICSGESTTLTATNYLADTFQWMISTDGSSFTNIQDATSNTYTTEALTQTKYYKISVRNGVCSSKGSGKATVTVKASTIGSKDAPTFNVAVGQSEGPKNFTFTQCGYSVTASDVSIVGTDASQFAMGTVTIDGNTITVPVTFTPASVGAKTASIQIIDASHQFAINATGACVAVTADKFNFTNTTVDYTGAPQAPSISAKSAEAGSVTNVYYNGTIATGKTDAGTYAISIDANAGTKYCAASQLALGNFVINKIDQDELKLTSPASEACKGSTVTLNEATGGSGTGVVTYAIVSGGTGTGSLSGKVLSCTTAGSIKVQATKAADTNYNVATSNTVTITFYDAPTAQTVTIDKASICSTGSATITVASSQTGYTYELYKDAASTSTTQIGDGTSLEFTGINAAGTYTVQAYKTGLTTCKTTMTGSPTLAITPDMALTSISLDPASICIGANSTVSPTGLVVGGAGSITYTSGTTAVATIEGTTLTGVTSGESLITATVSGGCGSTVIKTATLTVKPLPTIGSITATGGCGVGDIVFTANNVTGGATVKWYEGDTYLDEGSSYTYSSQAEGTSKTLKATATLNSCAMPGYTDEASASRLATPTLSIAVTSTAVTDGKADKTYEWETATFTPTTNGTITAKSIAQQSGSGKYIFGDAAGDAKTVKGQTSGDVFRASFTATGSNECTTTLTKDVTIIKITEDCSH